jgi:predicted 3-demethylubiquinone-9 3-methyltransferase (glyoxalase superfamily)
MQKISPFLWFKDNAEEAAHFYTGVFKDSRITSVLRYGEAGPGEKDAVMLVNFELEGQEFTALNGDDSFSFSPAISLFVKCETQEEVDRLWARLCEGGEPVQCGWLRDKFGVSWQIVPIVLMEMIQDTDAAKSSRVMKAMMGMVKLDIAQLKRAYEGA